MVCGLAFFALAGGILNLLHAVTPSLLIALVAGGAVAGLTFVLPRLRAFAGSLRRPDPVLALLIVLCCGLLALRYLSAPHRTEYQGVDDYEAYLVFPKKMLQLHYFAPDPFNERRLQSSIGIPYFWQDLLLAALPLECVQMVDQGAGVLLLAAAAWALGRRFALTRRQAWLLALAALALPHIRFNLTMTTLPGALFVAAAAFAADHQQDASGRSAPVLLGAAAALIVGAKSTYLPSIFLFAAFFYLLRAREHGWRRTGSEAALAGAVCLLILLPWAIGMRQTSGTYFFPLFGRGYDYTRYYHLPPVSTFHTRLALLKVFLFPLPLVPFLVPQLRRLGKDRLASIPFSITLAAILGAVVTGYATGGDSIKRYTWPCILPALIVLLAWVLRESRTFGARRAWGLPAFTAAVLLFWCGYMLRWEDSYGEMGRDLAASLRPWRIASPHTRARYAALQSALPANGAILETLDYPMLLDFRARRWLSADFPAAASPPPGWPIHGDGEALAAYLRAQGIRYLAYAYGDSAFLYDTENESAQSDPSVTQAWRNILYLLLQAHRQYGELSRTRQHVYDDGCLYVLDLEARSTQREHAQVTKDCSPDY